MYRQSGEFPKKLYLGCDSRLNQKTTNKTTDEGCPVIEESGTVCGETSTLSIFKEFRQIYDECLQKLEESQSDNTILKKLIPFRKLVEDLWEQNNVLVESFEELEQEATCRVTNLQDKLNKSCEKELHCKLKAKDREIECLRKKLSEKDDLLEKYCSQIEELKKDINVKNKKFREIVKQLKYSAENQCNKPVEEFHEESYNDCDNTVGLLVAEKKKGLNKKFDQVFSFLKELENQKKQLTKEFQNADCQLKVMTSEREQFLLQKCEISAQLEALRVENDKLLKEIADHKLNKFEKEELLKNIDQLKSEKNELTQKLNNLRNEIEELNSNFKETRWALTSEVAEKHDQVQELKRCVGALEEKLRQADMQTHFKDDIIKELRKDLKVSRKSVTNIDHLNGVQFREHSSPTQLLNLQPMKASTLEKIKKDEELKLDIRIFPINDNEVYKKNLDKVPKLCSVDVQAEPLISNSSLKMRNVSTQHTTRIQKLPRSFGTLTVTPWSGKPDEVTNNEDSIQGLKEAKKNLKGIYTVPYRRL